MAKPCPTCTAIISGTTPRCADCTKRQRRASRRRNGPRHDGTYSTTEWRRYRTQFLARNPNCVRCGAQATDVDHAPPRRILQATGITNPDRPTWTHPLCHRCHSWVTHTIDKPLLARLAAGDDPETLAVASLKARTYLHAATATTESHPGGATSSSAGNDQH